MVFKSLAEQRRVQSLCKHKQIEFINGIKFCKICNKIFPMKEDGFSIPEHDTWEEFRGER